MESKVVFSQMELTRASMGMPVRFNTTLTGGPTGHPGVSALLLRPRDQQALGLCLLAEHPGNEGASVTNGAREYAEAVCRALEKPLLQFAWFELDSEGSFDELYLMGDGANFFPLNEPGAPPRSLEGLFKRAERMFGDLPDEFRVAATACKMRFDWLEP
ncbi:hypothetical protein AB4Y45_33985 [Paraburkholderia sp. EG287A]|uniref:hypothetical protein n=1 Tax=Paraburkholderia sp. EG287A TaxID=3237012 RepID=UPI0034D22BAF